MAAATYAIFLPVRNGARFVGAAIESVLAQTRGDWTLIILENASTDATAAIANCYKDPRVVVLPSSSGLDIVDNWQRAQQILLDGTVRADHVAWIGHDDLLYPRFLESIHRLVEAHPQAGLYQTAFELIDGDGRLIRPCKPIPAAETHADFLAARAWGLRDSFGTGYVFRADDYLRVGGFPRLPQLMFADDLLFARLAERGGKVCADTPQCAYRLHRGSTSGALSRLRLNAQLTALDEFLCHIEHDFPAYWISPRGRSAVASLIAREVLIFRSRLLAWAISGANHEVVARLANLYRERAPDVAPTQWLGSNFVTRELYVIARQAFLAWALLRERWHAS